MTSQPVKHVIVVLGMHRSGTSAVTRGLRVMGVDLGGQLLPAVVDDNDKGFWEDSDVVDLDEDVLAQVGETWDSLSPSLARSLESADLGPWRRRGRDLLGEKTAGCDWFGMKDPRIVRLLPFWKPLFADLGFDVRYVLAVRHPLSVAASLTRRNGFVREKGLYLWLQHVIAAVQGTADLCRTMVDYDRLMAAPAEELRRVATDIGLSDRLDEAALREFCNDFLEDGLRHTRFGFSDLTDDPRVPRLVSEVYETVARIASGELGIESDEAQRAFDAYASDLGLQSPALELAAALDKANAALRQMLSERDVQLARLAQAETAQRGRLDLEQAARDQALAERDLALAERDAALAERDQARARAEAIEASTTWRGSAPLRLALSRARDLCLLARQTAGKAFSILSSSSRRRGPHDSD